MRSGRLSPREADVLVESFFPLAPVGLALVDEDMRYIRVNDAFATLTGRSADDHVGRKVADVVPEVAVHVAPIHARVLAGEPVLDMELRAETPAQPGVERCFLVSYYPVEGRAGRAVGIAVVDITKRVRAEEALRESEERFRSIFEHALVGMDVVDGDGRFLRANRAMCSILGRSEDELRELDFHEITHPDDRERSRRAFERLLRGELDHYDIEKRYLRPDGRLVSGRIMVAAVRDDERRIRLIVSQLLDLTDMKTAQERLLRHGRQLAEAERLAHIGSWEWRAGTDTGSWSDELYRIFGFEPRSIVPSVRVFQQMVHPDERERVVSSIRAAVRSGRGYTFDCRIVQPSGAVRAISAVGEPIRDEHGDLEGYIGSAVDVTDRRRQEAEAEAVANLREHALQGFSVTRLAQEATEVCARMLGAQYGGVLSLLPTGDLRLIAGVGWPQEGVGSAVLPGGGASHPGYALREGAPVVVDDWRTEERFPRVMPLPAAELRSAVVVPIQAADVPFGVLGLQSLEPQRFGRGDVAFLQAVAAALGTAIERRRAEDRIAGLAEGRRRLVAQTLDAEDETRRHISELLHDHALQELLAARQDLAEAAHEEDRAAEHAARARDGLERAIRQLREAVADLHPVVLEHGGLASALVAVAEHQARRGGFVSEVEVDSEAVGVHDKLILSLARELLHNAAKHAEARTVTVRVRHEPATLVLEVADDGRGFDPSRLDESVLQGHIGLASHGERVEGVGGRLEVSSQPGRGTSVRASFPVPA